MSSSRITNRWQATLALLGCLGAASAWGQDQPNQTLDQVNVFDTMTVLEMAFDDPNAAADFTNLNIAGSGLSACKLAANGLYCLATNVQQVQVVRYWKDTLKPTQSVDLLGCDDATLGLKGSRQCSGLTVDLSGAVWVSGRKNDAPGPNYYSLIKIEKASTLSAGSCSSLNDITSGWKPLTNSSSLCAREFATGPGALSDLDAVDGDVAAIFPYGNGILAIRDGEVALYFDRANPSTAPTFVVTPATAVFPIGTRLLSASLLQVPGALPADPVSNFILATTNTGKVLSTGNIVGTSPALAFSNSVYDTSPLPTSITKDTWGPCLLATAGATCTVAGATLTATGGTTPKFAQKVLNGATGLGVSGGVAAEEIGIGESLRVEFSAPRTVTAIEVLFLFNGPEFSDKAEIARVTTDQGVFKLSMRRNFDNDTADWDGPGVVTKCGSTQSSGTSSLGTGCLRITNPFPSPVTSLTFDAIAGSTPVSGAGSNESDYSIGRIETDYYGIRTSSKTGRAYLSNRNAGKVLALVPNSPSSFTTLVDATYVDSATNLSIPLTLSTAPYQPDGLTVAPGIYVDLATCGVKCAVLKDENGNETLSLSGVKLKDGPTTAGVRVFQVKNIPDCRYAPQDCLDVLGILESFADDAARRQRLIDENVIVPFGTGAPNAPAAQLLNVTPLLPEDVKSQFDDSGTAPKGLPPLVISRQYRGQAQNVYKFDAFFYKTVDGLTFLDTLDAVIDVDALTGGRALGCTPVPGKLFEWDVVTRVSETYRSVGSAQIGYIDVITNVGCGSTRTKPPALSLVPYNLEVAPDTYGPTAKFPKVSVVTTQNDGALARLVQSLHKDLGAALDLYTCAPYGPDGTTTAPLSKPTCDNLKKLWSASDVKLGNCVDASFQPKASASNENCKSFRTQYAKFRAALPATASGLDPANRLGEQKSRSEVIFHVFETRFLPSIPTGGYCRESGGC